MKSIFKRCSLTCTYLPKYVSTESYLRSISSGEKGKTVT